MKRLLTSSAIWARFARKHMVTDIDNVILYGPTKLTQVRKTMSNQFWTDVIRAWESFIRMWKPRSEQVITERLWFSDKTPYRSTVVRNWDNKGFRFFGDLFDADSKEMLAREELCEKFGIRINFLNYQSLRSFACKHVDTTDITKADFEQPFFPARLNLLLNNERPSKAAYDTFIQALDKQKQGYKRKN